MHNQIIIKISKDKLLSKLKENLSSHIETHKKALEAWKLKASEFVSTAPDKILKGEITDIRSYVSRVDDIPTSYAKSYESVIKMLEYSIDEVIELDHSDFGRYVEDNWEWKQSFAANSHKYLG